MDQQPRSTSLRPLIWGGALGAVIAAAVILAFTGDSEVSPVDVTEYLVEQHGQMEERALEVVRTIVNYDAETFAQNEERLRRITTGDFLDDVSELFSGELGEALEETGTRSTGTLPEDPISGFDSSRSAHVTVRVVQEIETRGSPRRIVFLVLSVGMTLDGQEWKAGSLRILSQQSPGS